MTRRDGVEKYFVGAKQRRYLLNRLFNGAFVIPFDFFLPTHRGTIKMQIKNCSIEQPMAYNYYAEVYSINRKTAMNNEKENILIVYIIVS